MSWLFRIHRKEIMQKTFIIIIIASALLLTSPANARWFDNKEEEMRFQEVREQLESQRHTTGSWQVIAGVFGVGAVLLFTIGTAIGSRVRRYEKKR